MKGRLAILFLLGLLSLAMWFVTLNYPWLALSLYCAGIITGSLWCLIEAKKEARRADAEDYCGEHAEGVRT